MIILLLFVSLTLCQQNGFMVMGLTTNLNITYGSERICDFNSCTKYISNILNNTASAYVALYPINDLTSCPLLPAFFNVNMITFILEKNKIMALPQTCNTMGDCLMKSCNSYLSSKNSYLMTFTGQCF
jgi:hypothetical protein